MNKPVKTYDFKKVIVTFGGIPITGFTDSSSVKVTASSELFTKKIGADGEINRSRKHDNTHQVTLTLMKSSASNTYLTACENMDRFANMGIRPLSITDLSGSSLHFWPQAWVNKDPDVEYATEAGDIAWLFETGHVAANVINGDYIPG